MSNRKYPRIGVIDENKKFKDTECCACKEKAFARVDIQTDYMRGNDDVFIVCEQHIAMLRNGSWRKFYSAVEDKKIMAKGVE